MVFTGFLSMSTILEMPPKERKIYGVAYMYIYVISFLLVKTAQFTMDTYVIFVNLAAWMTAMCL